MRADQTFVATASPVEWWKDTPLTPLQRSVPEWRGVVMDAFASQPALCLTLAQGERLWGMDAPTCGCVLDGLVEAGVLARTPDGQYCRAEHHGRIDLAFVR